MRPSNKLNGREKTERKKTTTEEQDRQDSHQNILAGCAQTYSPCVHKFQPKQFKPNQDNTYTSIRTPDVKC